VPILPHHLSRYQYLIDGDVNDADYVSDGAHDNKAHSNGLTELNEFLLGWFLASIQELCAFLQKLPRDLSEFLELVGHDDEWRVGREGGGKKLGSWEMRDD